MRKLGEGGQQKKQFAAEHMGYHPRLIGAAVKARHKTRGKGQKGQKQNKPILAAVELPERR